MKFEIDKDNDYVFSFYPTFEQFSETSMIGDKAEALDQGAAIIRKPIYDDKDGYYDMIRSRVKTGAKAYFVAGSRKIAELEIIELLGAL